MNRLAILSILQILVACTGETKLSPEQIALNYVVSDVIGNPGALVQSDTTIFYLWPPSIDSAQITNGLFYDLQLFGTTKVARKSRPFVDETILADTLIIEDSIKDRIKGYQLNYREQLETTIAYVKLPERIAETSFADFLDSKKPGVFIETKFHLKSTDELLVEIHCTRSDQLTVIMIVFLTLDGYVKGWEFSSIMQENEYQ